MSGDSEIAAQVDAILARAPRRRQRGCFTVVCPAYNRRRTLGLALDSLRAQTYTDWVCLILDDGSTDGTPRIAKCYARKDPRFLYVRYEKNRGGVMMNEIGMRVACELGEYWSRIGSDDWFEPHKLMVDYVTLGRNEMPACFGPIQWTRDQVLDRILPSRWIHMLRTRGQVAASWVSAAVGSEVLRTLRHRFGAPHQPLENHPIDARARLLSAQFAMSWANAAVRAEVLRKVRDRFGGFCDLQSRNMEDFHCNMRIASVSSIVWRGLKKDRKTVVIGAQTWAEAGDEKEFLHDGTWRMADDGASNMPEQKAFDIRISLAAIHRDFAQHPPEPCPAVRPRVVCL